MIRSAQKVLIQPCRSCKGSRGLRIARANGYFQRSDTPQAAAAVDAVAQALGVTRPVEFPEAHRARAAAFTITMIEGAALHHHRIRLGHRISTPKCAIGFSPGPCCR